MPASVRVQYGAALTSRTADDALDRAALRRLLARAVRATLRTALPHAPRKSGHAGTDAGSDADAGRGAYAGSGADAGSDAPAAAGPPAGEPEVSVTLLDDDAIAAMNEEFLSHAGPTDVISFALYEPGEPVVGDIYVGYDETVRQAAAAGVPAAEEFVRVTVHGVLHVLGHDHPGGDDRIDTNMWRIQEQIVAKVMAS